MYTYMMGPHVFLVGIYFRQLEYTHVVPALASYVYLFSHAHTTQAESRVNDVKDVFTL